MSLPINVIEMEIDKQLYNNRETAQRIAVNAILHLKKITKLIIFKERRYKICR